MNLFTPPKYQDTRWSLAAEEKALFRRRLWHLGVLLVLVGVIIWTLQSTRASLVEFYAATCSGTGWSQPEQAAGQPEATAGDATSFDGHNSASLSTPTGELICLGFNGETVASTTPKNLKLRLSWSLRSQDVSSDTPISSDESSSTPSQLAPADNSLGADPESLPPPPVASSSEPVELPASNTSPSENPPPPIESPSVPEAPPAESAPVEAAPSESSWLCARAHAATNLQTSFEFYYSLDGQAWQKFAEVDSAPLPTELALPLPDHFNWSDLARLQISVHHHGLSDDARSYERIWLDSLWLEAGYDEVQALPVAEVEDLPHLVLPNAFVDPASQFDGQETPVFELELPTSTEPLSAPDNQASTTATTTEPDTPPPPPPEPDATTTIASSTEAENASSSIVSFFQHWKVWSQLAALGQISSPPSDKLRVIDAALYAPDGRRTEIRPEVRVEGDRARVSLPTWRPEMLYGTYRLQVDILSQDKVLVASNSFLWGAERERRQITPNIPYDELYGAIDVADNALLGGDNFKAKLGSNQTYLEFATDQGGSYWLRSHLLGASDEPSAEIKREQIRWDNLWPGVSIEQKLYEGRIKEQITLADANAPSTFNFYLETSPGLSLKSADDKVLLVETATGETIGEIEPPTAFDQSGNQYAFRYTLDHNELTLSPVSPLFGVNYPLVIDPSYVIYNSGTTSQTTSAVRPLARTADGNLHSVYMRRSGLYYNAYYAKSTDGGQNWTETALSSETISQAAVSLAVDSTGAIHVVWQGRYASMSYTQIRYIKYTPGSGWGSITNLTTASYNQSSPSIAVDSSNNVHIVWTGANSDYPSYTQIRYIKYTAGSGWGSITNLTALSFSQFTPTIGVDRSDNLHVVFIGNTGSDGDQVFYRKYTVGSGWDSAPGTNISNFTDYPQATPSLALDSSNNVHVVWSGSNVSSDIYSQLFYRKYTVGSGWDASVTTLTSGSYDQIYPGISLDGSDNVHLLWSGTDAGSPTYAQVRHLKYTVGSGWDASPTDLTSASANQYYPKALWANFPVVVHARPSVPQAGYAFLWSNGTSNISYYASGDLAWPTPNIIVSGVAYQSNETSLATSVHVALRVNGGTPYTTTTDASTGAFSFSGVTASSSDVLTIYFYGASDSSAGTYVGNAVTVTDGVTDISDLKLIANHLVIAAHNGSAALSNTNLGAYDNDNNSANLVFTANSGTLSVEDGNKLYVSTGKTFQPGGAVTIGSGGLLVSGTGVFTASSNAISDAGDWTVATGATFTSTGTTTFNGNNVTNLDSGGTDANHSFYNLTVSNPFVVQLVNHNLNVTGAFTVALGGTFNFNGYNLSTTTTCDNYDVVYLLGGESISCNMTNHSGSVVEYSGTSGTWPLQNWTYDSIFIDGPASYTDSGTRNVLADFIIGGGAYTAPTSTLNVGGSFENNGTFTANGGTVVLNGTARQYLYGDFTGSSAFYNLTITNNSGTAPSGNEVTGMVASVDSYLASFSATGTFTITTGGVKIRFGRTRTYTFNNINWNGGAAGTRIYFRNTNNSGTWNLVVTGTQAQVSYVNVSRSNASGGSPINASDGTSVDATNNTNWLFAPLVSCSTNIGSTSFGALSLSGVQTSSAIATTTLNCTESSGCSLFVQSDGNGSSPGLYKSSAPTHLIASANATLSAGAEGYGIQATSSPSIGSGDVWSVFASYAGTGNTVGGLSHSAQFLALTNAPSFGRQVSVTHKAAIAATTSAGSYADTITYSCLGN